MCINTVIYVFIYSVQWLVAPESSSVQWNAAIKTSVVKREQNLKPQRHATLSRVHSGQQVAGER